MAAFIGQDGMNEVMAHAGMAFLMEQAGVKAEPNEITVLFERHFPATRRMVMDLFDSLLMKR